MPNHWTTDGDLVIEDKTLFHQVGWLYDGKDFHQFGAQHDHGKAPCSPVYQQIATWVDGDGWKD